MKSSSRIPLAIAIVLVILTLVLTTMPLSAVQRQFIGERDKLLHLLIFAITSFCVAWAASPRIRSLSKTIIITTVLLLIFATVVEAAQTLVPSRTFDIMDYGANCIGVAIGLSLFVLFRVATNRRQSDDTNRSNLQS